MFSGDIPEGINDTIRNYYINSGRFENQYLWILDKLKNKEAFSHIRYGDGECICSLSAHHEQGGTNYDGDRYSSPSLNKEIVNALVNPILSDRFIYGMADHCGTWIGEMKNHGIWNEEIKFKQSELFIWASIFGKIDMLFNILNKKKSILVAPKYLHQTNIKFNDYIETPTQNTWVARGKELVEEIHKKSLSYPKGSIFCFCVGMSSIPIIYHLHKLIEDRHTLIDIGSVIDPYVENGRFRSWMDLMPQKNKDRWTKQ